jgi:hypothetical protein
MLVRPVSVFNSSIRQGDNGTVLTPSDVLSDQNPHVKAHPELFEPVRETIPPYCEIEEATANPGEKRRK